MRRFTDQSTLGEIKAYLRGHWRTGKGIECPACTRNVHLRSEFFGSGKAKVLIEMYRRCRGHFIDPPYMRMNGIMALVNARSGKHEANDYGKLKYWGLTEPKPNDDPKKKHSGEYRLTSLGVQVVEGARVPSPLYVFEGYVYDKAETLVSITDALGHPFDFRELWEPPPQPLLFR